jgi:hypothetical protein
LKLPSLLALLDEEGGRTLHFRIKSQGCEHRQERTVKVSRNRKNGRLTVDGQEWTAAEERVLRLVLYRLENHLAVPWGSTSTAEYTVTLEGRKDLEPVSTHGLQLEIRVY